jgi:hypothetical protein
MKDSLAGVVVIPHFQCRHRPTAYRTILQKQEIEVLLNLFLCRLFGHPLIHQNSYQLFLGPHLSHPTFSLLPSLQSSRLWRTLGAV